MADRSFTVRVDVVCRYRVHVEADNARAAEAVVRGMDITEIEAHELIDVETNATALLDITEA